MNVLAVGAHHDDIEIGCGGTLALLKNWGNNIFGLILTNSETHYEIRSIHRTSAVANSETEKAAEIIGYELGFIDRKMCDNGELKYDTELMRQIEKFIAENDISMVFSHWRFDLNTDHEAAAKMTITAARHVPCVLMYRSNWYQPSLPFNGIFTVDISDVIGQKKQALECYQSEINNRGYKWIESFIDYNRCCGFGIDTHYAEIFEAVKYQLFVVGK